jgi:HEAT repeat protein
VELLAGDPSPAVRTNIAFNLGGFGVEAVEPLINAVRQNNSVRAAAITLGRIADERGIPALGQALENPENRSCRSDIADAIRSCSWRKDNSKEEDS